MNDYQKELWKKRQEYELAHKDNSKLPVKPKKKKKKVKSNTDNYVTGKVKQTTNKVTKDAKNKAHMQDLVNTTKTKRATKKVTKDAKRTAHTNDYSNITDSTKNGKKKKSKLKHSDLYFAHHGIEGQKWGKRHGPPYPLGSDISTGNRLRSTKELRRSIKAKKKTGEPLTDDERIYRNTRRASMLGGPIAGVVAGMVTKRKIEKRDSSFKKSVKSQLEKNGDIIIYKKGANTDDLKKARIIAKEINNTGKSKYADSALSSAIQKYKDPKLNKFKSHLNDIDVHNGEKSIRITMNNQEDREKNKPIKDKSGTKIVGGSYKWEDRLLLKLNYDGSVKSATIYRDLYDSYDGEYVDCKKIKEYN